MRRALAQVLIALVAALATTAGVLVVAQPRIVVGDPLPRLATGLTQPKPPPPKARILPDPAKPVALDLGAEPAPVGVATAEDPLVLALAPRLQAAIAAAGPAGRSAVHVMDADGRTVFDVGGATPMIPASTAKLVTAAVVLAAFGPDHTFSTTVAAANPPAPDGVVAGDLVLVGGADPTLVSAAYVEARIDPERPATPIDALADQVVAAGVTRVTGGVVGDPGFLRGPALAEGWPPRYLEELDATPISGLTVDEGLQLYEEGGVLRARAAPDPAAEAAAALTTALLARGVAVDVPPRSVPDDTPVDRGAMPAILAEVRSPPTSTLLARMLQDSDNHVADTLFRAAGRHAAGRGSFADAAALVPDLLAALRLDWSATTLQDGSGLSRETLIPPGLLTTLNYRMTRSPVGAAWQDLMAVSGVSGTLERRLVGTIAELRLRGKTGSLGDVRSITGAVVGPDGRPLYLTVASDGVLPEQLDEARRLQDLVILALAAELYGCAEVPPPPPAAPPAPGELPPLPTHTC
jgi:D-alanyl-D-alanine carboxypeptidase/D-alanyl-D-alanine-endopeptidase (penicillin-binding protein 4)